MPTCPTCEDDYSRLGQHWAYSPEHRPELSAKQQEIIIGLLMGDGCLDFKNRVNPRVSVTMANKQYLEYLSDKFGVLAGDVKLNATAEQVSEYHGGDPSSYSDLYVFRTRSHPDLEEFNWYKSGKKVWPDDINLTPTVLKHWYCGDGTFESGNSNQNIAISIWNERDNTEKISQMFKNSGLPTPSVYIDSEANCKAQFTKDDSEVLWKYMGQPLPGFEYKWPDGFK